jgi:hypothetical protein
MKKFASDKLDEMLEMEKQILYAKSLKEPDDPEQKILDLRFSDKYSAFASRHRKLSTFSQVRERTTEKKDYVYKNDQLQLKRVLAQAIV